ncbi:MAG: [acyl-carrier-protein] S-malonyltransferase [Clostridiales bacterium]|nr:[acyl-carrier-protein] S-malonyltransferase [Clostridiales bacterium]
MSKIAFLYPGQGAQRAGMGKDFYEADGEARALYEEASKLLGMDIAALCFEENEQLHQTEYTQPAMVTTCLAMTKVIRKLGITPFVCAGLSLGEYAAISAAGGLEETDAVCLVRKRGRLMEEAVPDGKGAMAAVLALDTSVIEGVLENIEGVTIANYNCPGQIVITGETNAVLTASEALKAAGAKRVLPLKVSGPFHSPLLEKAGEGLRLELEKVTFSPLLVPYVTNVTAEAIVDVTETKDLLVKQVASSVKWQQSVETMLSMGVDTFLEIGPGKTLAGFLKKIAKDAIVYNIETYEDAKKIAEILKQ